MESCHVALDKELQTIIAQAPEGEEARNGERLIQFASENLVTEVLIQPQLNTLIQCVRNLLSSFTKHRHIIHAGYTFAGNGSWIVQDGTFSLADLIDAFQEQEVQRVLRAYENSVTVDIHCTPEGDWSTARLRRESFSRLCRVRVNPDDSPSPAANIQQFVDYLAPFVRTSSIEQLLEPSEVVGNIRFSHPTLYVFPGGQGDAALFGINGFNMLVDGGFARKACFWDFARHLDRLDAVLMTRINNSNINGIASVLRRKKLSHVYPQIGHFFCNLQDRKQLSTPDEDKVRDPLLVSLLDEGQEVVQNLRHLQLKPHHCTRDSLLEPINLYHKVGHGKLDMYVISPAKDSKELKEFLSKWHSNDISLFTSASKKHGDKDISFPLQNLVSICALLVWQPANPEDTITRILFPGSTPQHKIFEGLEKLRSLEFMKHPICTAKTLSPSSSTVGISSKVSKIKSTPAVIDKLLPGEGLTKPVPKGMAQNDTTKQNFAKTATIPVTGSMDTKAKAILPSLQKPTKPKQDRAKLDNKTEIDKNIEADTDVPLKQEKPSIISEQIKDKESIKSKTEKTKSDNKPKKLDSKSSKINEKKPTKSSSIEKKDSVKSSPTTPKKSIEGKVNGLATKSEITKSITKSNKIKTSPSATPAKSTKEENNRKVAESKMKSAAAPKTLTGKPTKKEEGIPPKPRPDKKPTKKPTSASPVKMPSKSFSPGKATTKTVTKTKKDPKKLKGEAEKGIVTDSSTVSTPSTVDAEMAITKESKLETDILASKDNDEEVDPGKTSEKGKTDDGISKDIEDSDKTKDNINDVIQNEVIEKQEEKQADVSEKEFSEKDDEDEILIIEKVEIEAYAEDSTVDQESVESHIPDEGEDEIQKHLRDEAESEKKKDDQVSVDKIQVKDDKENSFVVESVVNQENTAQDDVPAEKIEEDKKDNATNDLKLNFNKDVEPDKVLTPENREQIEEEVQEIISSATDFVAKAKLEQSKESSELSAEGVGSDEQKTSGETKDLLSSPEKLNLASDKNLTDDENKNEDAKDKSRELVDGKYAAEESQPDEKFSTTVESGATTAPTLPEDERIPLDEIKEGVEEKYDKEDTKEKDPGIIHRGIEQPTTLPQVSIIPGGAFETQVSHMLTRDIVKTPDEVADLPVHEEVDGLYEVDDFSRDGSKGKEDLLSISSGKKDIDIKEEKNVQPDATTHDVKETSATKPIPEFESIEKPDEEELKTLQTIRQKLEEQDYKLGGDAESEILQIAPSLDVKGAKDKANVESVTLHKTEIDLDIKEIVVDKDVVHTTLKAPEVAEHVLVTPDSAPDSPLHYVSDKKQSRDLPADLKADTDIENKADNGRTDTIVESQEFGKQLTDIPETILESGLKDESIPEDKGQATPISKETVEAVTIPKTPPASPISVEPEKIITEEDELVKEIGESVKKIDDIQISLEMKSQEVTNGKMDEKVEDTNQDTQEEKEDLKKDMIAVDKKEVVHTESIGVTDDTTILKPDELSVNTEKIASGQESDDFLVIEKIALANDEPKKTEVMDSHKDLSPLLSELSKDSDKQSSITPIPGDDDVSKTGLQPENEKDSDIKHESSKREDKSYSEDLKTQDKTQDVTNLLKKDDDKPVSPVSSEKEDISRVGDAETVHEEEFEKMTEENRTISKSPVPTDTVDKQILGEELVVSLDKQESPISVSPTPSDKKDSKEENEFIHHSDKKEESPKSITPILFEKDEIILKDNILKNTNGISSIPIEQAEICMDTKLSSKDLSTSFDEKHETEISSTSLPGEKGEEIVEGIKTSSSKIESPEPINIVDRKPLDEEVVLLSLDENHEIQKNISQGLIEKLSYQDETMSDSKKLQHDEIMDHEVKMLESSGKISPVPSERDDKNLREGKISSPKSESPLQIEIGDKKLSVEDLIIPKDIDKEQEPPTNYSLTPSEKDVEKLHDATITSVKDVNESLKPSSPILSKKGDDSLDKEKEYLDDKHSTPKSNRPTLNEAVSEKETKDDPASFEILKEPTLLDTSKKDEIQKTTEKDSAHEIKIEHTKLSHQEKPDTPKSTSPAPSDDEEVKSNYKLVNDKQDTPKSISPVPSEKIESSHETPLSVSPVQNDKNGINLLKEKDTEDRADTNKRPITPDYFGKEDEKEVLKEEEFKEKSKHSTPKSISPVPSDKSETKEDIKKPEDTLTVSKTVSPISAEKDNTNSAKVTENMLDDKNHDFQKSVSPVISGEENVSSDDLKELEIQEESKTNQFDKLTEEKEKLSKGEEISTQEKSEISLIPSDMIEDINATKDLLLVTKSVSPVPPEIDNVQEFKAGEEVTLDINKDDTSENAVGSVEMLKGGTSTDALNNTNSKHDSSKSTSPVHEEKEDEMKSLQKEKTSLLQEVIHDAPTNVNLIPSDDEILQNEEIKEEKQKTTACVSLGPDIKDSDTVCKENENIVTDVSKHDIEKSDSPAPSNESNVESKEDAEVKHVISQSINTVHSKEGDEKEVLEQVQANMEKESKADISQVASRIPCDGNEKNVEDNIQENITPRATNTSKTEEDGKEIQGSKDISSELHQDKKSQLVPATSTSPDTQTLPNDVAKEASSQEIYKRISPIPSEKDVLNKEQDLLVGDTKYDTPKSTSPVPSDVENVTDAKEDLKQSDTQIEISYPISDKEIKMIDQQKCHSPLVDEKQDTSKSSSPTPAETDTSVTVDSKINKISNEEDKKNVQDVDVQVSSTKKESELVTKTEDDLSKDHISHSDVTIIEKVGVKLLDEMLDRPKSPALELGKDKNDSHSFTCPGPNNLNITDEIENKTEMVESTSNIIEDKLIKSVNEITKCEDSLNNDSGKLENGTSASKTTTDKSQLIPEKGKGSNNETAEKIDSKMTATPKSLSPTLDERFNKTSEFLNGTSDYEPDRTREKADYELSEKFNGKSPLDDKMPATDIKILPESDQAVSSEGINESMIKKDVMPKEPIELEDLVQSKVEGKGVTQDLTKSTVNDDACKGEEPDISSHDNKDSAEEHLKESVKHHSGKSDIQEKGILETLQSEKDLYEEVSNTNTNEGKLVDESIISQNLPSGLSEKDLDKVSDETNIPDKRDSSSSKITKSKEESQTEMIGEKQSSDNSDSKFCSSDYKPHSDANGHSGNVDDTTLDDRDLKAVVKEQSVNDIVPSQVLSVDDESLFKSTSSKENDDAKQQSDSVIKEIHQDNIKDGLIKPTIGSSAKADSEIDFDDVQSSVHRMLVTGSSEDGGTETELCSSSVIRITNDSHDKQLGNISHQGVVESPEICTPSSSSKIKVDESSELSKVCDAPTSEKAVTTTQHFVNGQDQTNLKDNKKQDQMIKTVTTTTTTTVDGRITTVVKTTEESISPQVADKAQSLQDGTMDSGKSTKPTSEAICSGAINQTLKREVSDAGRSGTPASDMASEREFETGGPSTPHSDISSGQASRAATNVWGESSEGRPDSRHCESDDDIPCSPMSVTSHIAQSPPQFDFDVHQHSKEGFYEESLKQSDVSIPSAMTSSLYGSLPEENPLDEYLKQKVGESQMYSSMYVSKYSEDDQYEYIKQSSTEGKDKFEAISKPSKEDIDFETAVQEHRSTRGEDLTTKYTNGKSDSKYESTSGINGKSTCSKGDISKQPHENGKASQPESIEYLETPTTSAKSEAPHLPQKAIPSQTQPSESPSTLSSSGAKPLIDDKKDPIEGWGKPLGLPPPPKNLIDSPLSRSTLTLVWNPADEWGIPLGLPSPAPPPTKKDSINSEIDNEITSTSNKTTPKKVARRNAENKSASNTPAGKEASNKSKHPESPVKRASNKDTKAKHVAPIYMDLTYVPHHGNSHYTNVEFFKRIRARYYVFSGTEPSREVFNALLEAKQTWEDKDLEVTIIPTYDTDTLGYWVAENEDVLAKYKIDLSPSASRCTINLQDHETSCSAYRLEF